MGAEVEATPLRPVMGEAGFLGATGATAAAVPAAARPEPSARPPQPPEREAESQPQVAPVQRPVVLAPRRTPRTLPADGSLGRLVRTSVSLYEHDQAWLKEVAEQRGSVGVRRATKDFVARGLIRAVVELDPQLDLRGITLDDEDEFVARVKQALVELGG